MKLIFCTECQDVIKVIPEVKRTCHCGKAWGVGLDSINIEIGGTSVPIGFSNPTFAYALSHRPREEGNGFNFTAFVIPKVCRSIKEIK